LTGTHADTKIFIIRHLLEVVNTIHKNEIGAERIITAIAQNIVAKYDTFNPHFLGNYLDIATLAHMSILDAKGGTDKYSHHKQILFVFPAVTQTTITNKKN